MDLFDSWENMFLEKLDERRNDSDSFITDVDNTLY